MWFLCGSRRPTLTTSGLAGSSRTKPTGASGTLRRGECGALFGGLLEQAYRAAMVNTFGGGVNEVQRDIIAMAGLGLPRARR